MEFRQKFIEDASELLTELEQTILKLEKNPNDSALIEAVFRAMHTLKGTAGMYGFEEIGKLTHRIENIYDLIRNGRIAVSKPILDLTLQSIDFLNNVLHADENEIFTKEYEHYYNQINDVLNIDGEQYFDGNQNEIEKIEAQTPGMKTWFITIKPTDDLRKRGVKMHAIFDEIDAIGTNQVFNRQSEKGTTAEMFWEIILATETPIDELQDILLFVDDISEINILAEYNLFDNKLFADQLQEILKEPFTDFEKLSAFVEQIEKAESTEIDATRIAKPPDTDEKTTTNIKVSAERLDEQMTLLSELVTAKSELQLLVDQKGYADLLKTVEQIDKIARRFRKNIFKIRLIPIETLQIRFDRLIRDLSNQLDKHIDFLTEGMQTELDKTIIDQLEKPLMHLIRNCLDHGIETREIREMRGKAGRGKIWLTARQAATNVIITVEDDGEGISIASIRQKAIEKGIIEKNEKLTDHQLSQLIFMPGFSTARNLTEISGRGVGMDIVKQAIKALRGTIDIQSEKGKGTKFTIKIPLTLSIIDTLLVKSGVSYYSIPITAIDKCIDIKQDQLEQSENNHIIVHGQLIPYIHLKQAFKVAGQIQPPTDLQKEKAVILKNDKNYLALIVDEVIGDHQAVLKDMGNYFKHLEYISGASQLADGRISIVLDPERLINGNISF